MLLRGIIFKSSLVIELVKTMGEEFKVQLRSNRILTDILLNKYCNINNDVFIIINISMYFIMIVKISLVKV